MAGSQPKFADLANCMATTFEVEGYGAGEKFPAELGACIMLKLSLVDLAGKSHVVIAAMPGEMGVDLAKVLALVCSQLNVPLDTPQ